MKLRVEIDPRMRRRQRKAAVSNYLKGLTELITNSDQSYSNVLQDSETGSINIYVDRKKRLFKVVDNAEGLSREDMIEFFKRTGAKHKSHKRGGRSLFGKGLSDTLFSPITVSGEVHSIKDGKYNVAKFFQDPKDNNYECLEIQPDDAPAEATKELRELCHVSSGNGTCVAFKLGPKISFPRNETVAAELKNFYALRFINMNDRRFITLHILHDGEDDKIPIRFKDPDDGIPIGKELSAEMKFMDYPRFQISGKLFKTNKPLKQGEVALEKRSGGLLIFDENKNVIDLQLFGFSDDPNAKPYYGYLELDGAYEILRDYMDKEDEAVITETRDGFDGRSVFYKKLKKIIDTWLAEIIREDQESDTKHTGLSKDSIERQKKAFNELNKLYQKINDAPPLLDEKPGEKKGLTKPIEFSARKVNIVAGKKYKISLHVNTDLVSVGSSIKIIPPLSDIHATPNDVTVKNPSDGKIFSDQVMIWGDKANQDGVLKAEYNDEISDSLYVNVVTEEMHTPQNGIEFYPHKLVIPPGAKKSANLYVDLTKVGINELISVNTDDKGIRLIQDTINLTRATKSIGNVSRYQVQIMGLKEGSDCKVIARSDKFESELHINIREHKIDAKSTIIFNDWEYKPLSGEWQAFPSISNKKIQINSNHPINKKFLGNTPEEADERFAKYPHCQLLVGDLVLSIFLEYAFKNAYNTGNLDDPDFDINKYVRQAKNEFGLTVLEGFINFSNMKSLEGFDVLWKKD